MGSKAFDAVFPRRKRDIIGKSIKFLEAEFIYTYHPNARIKRNYKKKAFVHARKRIKSYL